MRTLGLARALTTAADVARARCTPDLRWARSGDLRSPWVCRLAMPLGLLEGPRPSPATALRLCDTFAAERRALVDLKAARRALNHAIRLARSEGATFTAIAAAIVPATGDVAKTIAARDRMAANLRGRLWEERRRRSTEW